MRFIKEERRNLLAFDEAIIFVTRIEFFVRCCVGLKEQGRFTGTITSSGIFHKVRVNLIFYLLSFFHSNSCDIIKHTFLKRAVHFLVMNAVNTKNIEMTS